MNQRYKKFWFRLFVTILYKKCEGRLFFTEFLLNHIIHTYIHTPDNWIILIGTTSRVKPKHKMSSPKTLEIRTTYHSSEIHDIPSPSPSNKEIPVSPSLSDHDLATGDEEKESESPPLEEVLAQRTRTNGTTASWRALGPPPDGGSRAWIQGVFL